jgi:hypothetical protein
MQHGVMKPSLIIINLFLFLTFVAWRSEKPFVHQSSPPHHCPFTPVDPGYGADLFEDDYLLLLLAADLRIDPALRPRPVSSLTSATLYNSTTVHRFSVATSARLRKSECVFRFYVYGGIFNNPPGFFFFICTWNSLFLFLFFFVAWGGRVKCE